MITVLNPPFGTSWKDAEKEIRQKDFIAFPATSDMQMLFLQEVQKADRAVVITNGSPLFTGNTTSGESQIRRWILEQDLLETIVQLPQNLFQSTGITTYLWIFSKNKKHKGKIQLIDASKIYHKLRRAQGEKRVEMTPEDMETVLSLYESFESSEQSKIFDASEFLFREVFVYRPLKVAYQVSEEGLKYLFDAEKVEQLKVKKRTKREEQQLARFLENQAEYERLKGILNHSSDRKFLTESDFKEFLKETGVEVKTEGFQVRDEQGEVQYKSGKPVLDTKTKDSEIIKINEDVEEYMKREVLPHIPDAIWVDENRIGAEIPFQRYFYKYQKPQDSDELLRELKEKNKKINRMMNELFKSLEPKQRESLTLFDGI